MPRTIDQKSLSLAIALLFAITLIGIFSAALGASLVKDSLAKACDQRQHFTLLRADGDVTYICTRKQFTDQGIP